MCPDPERSDAGSGALRRLLDGKALEFQHRERLALLIRKVGHCIAKPGFESGVAVVGRLRRGFRQFLESSACPIAPRMVGGDITRDRENPGLKRPRRIVVCRDWKNAINVS